MKGFIELTEVEFGTGSNKDLMRTRKALYPIEQIKIAEYPNGINYKDASKILFHGIEWEVLESYDEIKSLISSQQQEN